MILAQDPKPAKIRVKHMTQEERAIREDERKMMSMEYKKGMRTMEQVHYEQKIRSAIFDDLQGIRKVWTISHQYTFPIDAYKAIEKKHDYKG